MLCLLDTNIIVRLANRHDPLRPLAQQAVQMLRARGEQLCYTSQILAEFWNVSTRPATARGGLGMSVARTDRRVRLMERYLVLLHDARLVAAMRVYRVPLLLTFNVSDFLRYPGITVLHPQDLVAAP